MRKLLDKNSAARPAFGGTRHITDILLILILALCIFTCMPSSAGHAQDRQAANINSFGGGLLTFGQGVLGGLFGIQDTKNTKSVNQPTPGNWTKDRARVVQGGADPTGFWAPPPISDFRSEGIHKNTPSTGNEVLNFWINVPGDINVGQTFDYGPYANYGTVEKAMVWDVNGYVMGGYTKTYSSKVKLRDKHKLVIEKWDPELSIWDKISERDSSTGTAGFNEQGYYRLTVALYRAAFRLAPQYGTVLVVDPRFERKGSEIYYNISTKLPSPYSGLGMTISGHGKRQQYKGDAQGWRPECGKYEVRSWAKKGVVEWESSGSQKIRPTSEGYYEPASWILRGNDGSILWKNEQRGSFVFDADYWGDGKYTLETYLAKGHQGQGIQNMPAKHCTTYITVYECGKSLHKPPATEQKTFEGDTAKTTTDIPNMDANKFAQIDGNNLKQVPHIPPFDVVNHNLPKDTPNPPAEICRDCPKLQRQISHRTKQLQIQCDAPGNLMEQMLKAPKRYDDMEKDLAKEWNAILTKIQGVKNPFTKLAFEYAQLIMKASKANLIISAKDQKNYRPTDKFGNPSVVGYGIPNGYCVFDKAGVALANQLRADQKRIYNEWARLRQEAERNLAGLKKEIGTANERFGDYFTALLDMRKDLSKMQTSLSDMYYSGKYEHCLGGGGERTSGNYTITQADGKKVQGAAWGLPGMNIQLPEPKKKQIDPAIVNVPKPLHEIQPLKIKWDGIKQLETDRKLMESLAEAKRLQYEAEYGSWTNWVGSKMMWVAEFSMEIQKYNPVTAPLGAIKTYFDNISSGMPMDKALEKAYNESWGPVAGAAKDVGTSIYEAIAVKPFHETMKNMDAAGSAMIELIPKIFEGLGDDVAKYIHANNDVLKEIEQDMDQLNELHKYGDTPEANTQRLAIYMKQMDQWKKMEEGGKAMDNIIMTVATSNSALSLSKAVAGKAEVALGGLKKFIQEGMLQSKNLGLAVGEKAVLGAKAAYLDDMAKAGNMVSDKVDDVIKNARDTVKSGGSQIDDALRAQQEATKKLADKLDDAVALKQDEIAKINQPSKWDPIKQNVDVPGDQIKNAGNIGSGTTGTVKDLGDGRVAKVFDKGNAQNQISKFQDEMEGLQNLRDADIPHIKAESGGTVKIKGSDTPVIVKEKFTANQSTIGDIVDGSSGRKMTRQEMIEALDFYDKAAKKGVVFGDPNSGNLVKEMLPDGNYRMLATEGGSVAKIADPKKAREMMTEILTKPVDTAKKLDTALDDMAKAFERIGGDDGFNTFSKFVDNGFTLSDTNIAKHIDKDLLEAFKNPAAWEKTVKDARRASALASQGQYLDDAARASVNTAQQSLQSANQTVKSAVENVSRKAAVVEKEIIDLSASVPSVAVPAVIYGPAEQAIEKGKIDNLGDFFNDPWFGGISFHDWRRLYHDSEIAYAA